MSPPRLIADLRADGEVISAGEFTLDREKAREKLRHFQLADPRRYVLELVQAAVLKGAERILFEIDSRRPFEPHPAENAFPMFEWGLNWCIATSAHRYMMLHAGTVAFGDQALIMPGTPGSGKSTLSAALHLRGARLLSDEFGLVRPELGDLVPMPRGIPLKNASIEAILEFDPAAPLGPTYPKTRKGRVRHLRPDRESQIQQQVPAVPRWLVFPKYQAGAEEILRPLDKTEAFRQLAFNCFNYKLLGETSFRAVAQLIRQMDCYTFTFSNLDRAVAQLSALAQEPSTEEITPA